MTGAEREAGNAARDGELDRGRARGRANARASSAPPTPTPPQAAICHAVHGPWPKKTFDTSAVIAPTAKPGTGPSA